MNNDEQMKGGEGECSAQRKKKPKDEDEAEGTKAGGTNAVREHQ